MSLDDALEDLAVKAKKRQIRAEALKQQQQKIAPTTPNPDQPIVKL